MTEAMYPPPTPPPSHAPAQGGFRYGDAQTDDARLVLRVIFEALQEGAVAINYISAEMLLRNQDGEVIGARLQDRLSGRTADIHAKAVVNATGAWADRLRGELGAAKRIRPLRGSHLIFTAWRLPVAQAISFLHPLDHRPVFIFPWEGVTLVGVPNVLVQISIAAIEGSVTVPRPLQLQGLEPGLSAQASPDSVDVLLLGPLPVLDQLAPEDVVVLLDLTGLAPGTHQVTPQVSLLPEQLSACHPLAHEPASDAQNAKENADNTSGDHNHLRGATKPSTE